MRLISKTLYQTDHFPKEDIIICPCDDSLFTPSCYYFRLGGFREGSTVVPMVKPLKLGRRDTKAIFTLETFSLSSRVFAIVGPCSELLLARILLHNSPTIDPGFSGSLEMLLENQADEEILLEPGMRIGKAVFFDIADTLLDLGQDTQRQKDAAAWRARSEAGRIIGGTACWVEKTIDTEKPKRL
jgi:dUTPase